MGFWDSLLHPRAPKGSAGGGQFAGGGSPKAPKVKVGKRGKGKKGSKGKHPKKHAPKGALGFNGKTGTGYGSPHGDSRVRALQTRLNALGLKDAQGHPLKVDGRLGPKTTAAIKAWQRKNKMPVTGKVSAAALRQLTAPRSKTGHLRKPRPSLTAGTASRSR